MANATIDFDRCFQDLSKKFPEIKSELERRIGELLGVSIVPTILLITRPPRIDVTLPLNQQSPSPETRRKQASLAISISQVASDHNLNVSAYSDSKNSFYNFNPTYGEYRIKS